MLGLCICAGSAVLIALGFLLPGGVLLLIASGFDILDGALARVSGREQKYGAFLDSTVDRYAEAMTSIALLYYFIFHGHHTLEPMLVVFALTGSLLVSYVRARAQSLGFNGDGGLDLATGNGTTAGDTGSATVLLNEPVRQRVSQIFPSLSKREPKAYS